MNTAFNKAQVNYDNALPIENIKTLLEKATIENEADSIIANRFDDLVLFINDNGNADVYDKHFEAMLKGHEKSVSKAYSFIYEEAKKLAKEKLDKLSD